MLLRLRSLLLFPLLAAAFGIAVPAQETTEKKDQQKEENKAPAALDLSREAMKNPTAEQVAETSILIYGLGGGRAVLNQIRRTSLEKGRITVTTPEGQKQQANYSRWTQRAETLDKEKIRLDQEFPSARYSLVLSEDKIYGIYNNSVFTPREDASKAFHNQIFRGLDALLRYKENGSSLALGGKEKIQGVEYFLVDVTDKAGQKTRFYISVKTFRVMMLDYEEDGVKYRRKFYDYNYAQGTLVPYRTVLWADDKIVEETEVGTVTFGQKIDESVFTVG